MKTTSFLHKYLKLLSYPIIIVLLFVFTCTTFNFLLVPPKNSTIVETVMADAGKLENIDVAFMGSSRTFRGVDAPNISQDLGQTVFDIAHEHANYYSTFYLLNELIKKTAISTVFLEISITNFSRDEGTEEKYIYRTLTGEDKQNFASGIQLDYTESEILDFTNHIINFSNGRFYSNIINRFAPEDKIGSKFNSMLSTYMGNGYLKHDGATLSDDKILDLPTSYFVGGWEQIWSDNKASKIQVEHFHKIVELCQNKSINLVLYSPPYPISITAKYQQGFEDFYAFIDKTIENYNLEIMDFSLIKKDLFTLYNANFSDANHLNAAGADLLYPTIANICKDLQSNAYNSSKYFYDTYSTMIADYNLQ